MGRVREKGRGETKKRKRMKRRSKKRSGGGERVREWGR